MNIDEPSRRQLLAGLLAGLFGWCWPGRTQAQAPPAAAPSPPKAAPAMAPFGVGAVTTYVYDSDGTLLGLRRGGEVVPLPADQPFFSLGGVTTMIYYTDR